MILNKIKMESGGKRHNGICKAGSQHKPLISIITVVLNGINTLARAIQSVKNQSYDNIEYILIDGGSTDGTLELIKENSDYIDFWISEKDCGIYDAFNKGIKYASGDYYIIMGCDDILYKDSINEIVSNHLTGADIDFIVGAVMVGSNLRSGVRPGLRWLGSNAMISSHSLGLIIKKSLHQKIGFYSTRLILSSDGLFIKKLFDEKLSYISSDVIMGEFTIGGISNTATAQKLCENFLVQLYTEKNFKFLHILIFFMRLIKNYRKI